MRFGVAAFLSILLASCSGSGSGAPTEADVEAAFGIQIHDNQCVSANGKPGFMCTFITDGTNWTITRRLIQTDNGWQGVDGN